MVLTQLQLAADDVGVVSDEAGTFKAYRYTALAVPPADDFATLQDAWPGDVVVGPHGLALGNTAAHKKQAFQDSARTTFLNTTNGPRVDSIDAPSNKDQAQE